MGCEVGPEEPRKGVREEEAGAGRAGDQLKQPSLGAGGAGGEITAFKWAPSSKSKGCGVFLFYVGLRKGKEFLVQSLGLGLKSSVAQASLSCGNLIISQKKFF